MADTQLILKDGTTYNDSDCGYADRRIWCWIKNATFAQVFADFSDPEKTAEIRRVSGYSTTVYSGFTDMDVIRKTEYEPGKYTIDVRLGGEDIHVEEEVMTDAAV